MNGNSGSGNIDSYINNMMGSMNSKPYTTTSTTKSYISTTTAKPYTATTASFKAATTQAYYAAAPVQTTTRPVTTATSAATSAGPVYKANNAIVGASSATTTSTAAAYSTSVSATPSASSQSTLTQNSFDIQQMACLVNYQRKLKGASPLTISSGINKIALGQSMFQAQTQTMTHSGVNNSTLIDRFDAANYPSQYVAENVAWNQRTAADVVQAWVNSPGHYANMINPLYTEFGCTAVNWYWTFDFGSSTGQGNTVPNCSGYQIP